MRIEENDLRWDGIRKNTNKERGDGRECLEVVVYASWDSS